MPITIRQNNMLEYLAQANQPLTSEDLATHLGVSPKTIRNDIQALNHTGKGVIIDSKRGVGYFIADNSKTHIMVHQNEENFQYEVLKAVIDSPQVNLYELADKLFISDSALMTMVSNLNNVIAQADPSLQIRRVNNDLLISGTEGQRRHVFNLFLAQEIREKDLPLDKYASYFAFSDLRELYSLINTLHEQEHIKMNGFAAISFVLHISVLLERIHEGNYVYQKQVNLDHDACREYAEALKQLLEKKFQITLPDQELAYIYHLYLGQFQTVEPVNQTKLDQVIHQVLTAIRETFYVDFSRDIDLAAYLRNHMKSLYQRAQTDRFLINPLTSDIKTQYPFIYNLSVFAAVLFQKRLEFQIPDDEIAYIALHFLASYDTIQSERTKNILLITPYGLGNQRLIQVKLNQIENFEINVKDTPTIKEALRIIHQTRNVDLVLTTEPIHVNLGAPIFLYHGLLSDEDVAGISRFLQQEEKTTHQLVMEKFMDARLFFPAKSLTNPEDVIRFLCQKLVDNGDVDANYVNLVLERERLSSTAYENNHAIPHAIQRVAMHSAIAVCSLPRAIDWNGKKVRLVLLLALTSERKSDFEDLFGELVKVLDSTSFVNRLARVTEFETFIELCKKKVAMP